MPGSLCRDVHSILNITNGDSTTEIMRQAGIPGDHLPWRDVLHDGPVPAGPTFDELAMIRARFIADCGWGEYSVILSDFQQRNAILDRSDEYQKVILWFEHDLYDQLQILQVLDFLGKNQLATNKITMIYTRQYLGMLSPEQMTGMFAHEAPVTPEQLSLAGHAWAAFCDDTPHDWLALLDADSRALPFLQAAVLRTLQEFPSCYNGLSRTEQQALELVSRAFDTPANCSPPISNRKRPYSWVTPVFS